MPTLAPKLPWTHPFAGGYPRVGGQALPSDPDAIDYLERLAAVEAPVEVGVAMAVDGFVKGCKSDGIWDAIKASCLLCGPRTLSGALVPLVGTAPTSYAFASGDYNRVTGLKGDGSTTYLDSNRANNADGQDDHHISAYVSTPTTSGGPGFERYFGVYDTSLSPSAATNMRQGDTGAFAGFSRNNIVFIQGTASGGGIAGLSRSSSAEFSLRIAGATYQTAAVAYTPASLNAFVFCANLNGSAWRHTNARLAFYSIGSSLSLESLDTHVSRYVAGIQFYNNTGLSPHQYDDATISYINAGYAAGGTL